MSDFDPRSIGPIPSHDANQLPAIASQMPSPIGPPMPASPWMEPNETKGGFNFMSFLHSLRRRWLLGLGLGVVIASAIALFIVLLVPVKYEAFVQIRVRRVAEQMLRDKYSRPSHPQDYEIEKQTQAALLKSPFVISNALNKAAISQLPLVRDERWFGRRKNPVAWLERQLKVEFAQGSEFLRLSMRERNQEQLVKLLNAITKSYMDEIVLHERSEQNKKLNKLKDRHRSLHREITAQYEQIAELAKTYGSTQSDSVKVQIEMGYREIAALDREKHTVDQQFFEAYDALMMQQQRMQSSSLNQPQEFLIEDILLQYPEYGLMKSQLLELEQTVKFGGVQAGSPFGASAQMQSQISSIKQQMEEFRYEKKGEAVQRWRMMNNSDEREMQQEYEMMQARALTLDKRRKEIYARHKQLSDSMRQIGAFSSDLQVRQLSLDTDQEMMDRIMQEIETLDLDLSSKPQIEVLQDAFIPDNSNWATKYMQVIAAWCLALIGTVLGITLWDMQSQRVNNSQEVTESGDVRVIGTLPALSGRRAGGLLPLSNSARRSVEFSLTRSIDSIRTALLFAKKQQPYEVIMVSSALGQEGKTTVASQLGVSFARSGRRTLLIDGDVRNPQQHIVLGMAQGKGLCDLLRSDVTLDDVLKPTSAEGLWFLGAGYRDMNTDQFMASAVMGQLFAELRSRFDLIIIDTGPALTSPDAMLLGQYADTAVISVRRDESRLPKVTEACERLRSVGINIAGVVLNGAAADVRESELALPEAPANQEDPQLEQV